MGRLRLQHLLRPSERFGAEAVDTLTEAALRQEGHTAGSGLEAQDSSGVGAVTGVKTYSWVEYSPLLGDALATATRHEVRSCGLAHMAVPSVV